MIVDLKFPLDEIDRMFPCRGEEGTDVQFTEEARFSARVFLHTTDDDAIAWHLPDVFSVRYGSSYVATASLGDRIVRFHSNEGEFKEGDDK